MTIWQMSERDVFLIIGLLFGVFGFLRGARRELRIVIGVIIAYVLVTFLEDRLVATVNRAWFFLQFALAGGLTATDLASVLTQVRGRPPLIQTEGQRNWLKILTFFSLISMAYYWSRWRLGGAGTSVSGFFGATPRAQVGTIVQGVVPRRSFVSPLSRLGGAVLGFIGGYIIAYFLFRLIMGSRAVAIVPTQAVTRLQEQWFYIVVLLFLAAVILVGWERLRGTR